MHTDEGYETRSSKEAYLLQKEIHNKENASLKSAFHLEFVLKEMEKSQDIAFSTIYPWVALWMSNALFSILGREQYYEELNGRISKLNSIGTDIVRLQRTGICGGHGQLPNLGSTYAGLVVLKTLKRGKEIDKEKIIEFIEEMRTDRGFSMHKDGEEDIRAIYCAVASFSLMFSEEVTENTQYNPLHHPDGRRIFEGLEKKIYMHQTYEGGFAGAPGEEAHGGYTFCAIGTLKILQKEVPNMELLRRWIGDRQDPLSMGLSGRSEKNPDSCYNFWVGACFKMTSHAEYSSEGLAMFTLSNCQGKDGGMKSVPKARPDVYHTAYSLVGLYILESTDFNYVLGLPAIFPEKEKDSEF